MVAVAFFVGVVLGFVAPTAVAGASGRIVFATGSLELISPDGTGRTAIPNTAGAGEPAWSPAGDRIAFQKSGGIWLVATDGSGLKQLTTSGGTPTWSPDGEQIAFHSDRDGNREIYAVRLQDGVVQRLTQDAARDANPAWSPDGSRIAFISNRSAADEVWAMPSAGGAPVQLSTTGDAEGQPSWHPSGDRLAFTVDPGDFIDLFTVPAAGGEATRITFRGNDFASQPAFSPDGTRLAFASGGAVWLAAASGGGGAQIPNTDTGRAPDWEPAPPLPAGCGTRSVQVGQVTVEGTLAETSPGSGVFRAGAGSVVYAGGFELRPRVGGELLVDPGAGTLAEGGAGVDVHFGAVPVPLGVAAIPVGLADATVALNRDGTLLKSLFSLPISGQFKSAWADGGRAAALELELEAEKLLGSFGTFESGAAGQAQAPSLKVQARQVNCTGFDLTGAEVKADELSFIPTALKVPRKLGLKNVLFKYEDRGGRDFWSGQGELLLPISQSSPDLAVGGRVTIADRKLAGVGVSVSGINRRLAHGFFLQKIAGEVAFEPDFGASFAVDGTFGPQVRDAKLASFGGSLRLFALATDCTSGQDPIALGFTAAVPVLEKLGAGSIKYEGLNCLYTSSLAFEQTGKIDATLGQVVKGEIPNPVLAVKANLSGFVGEDRIGLEGGGSVTLPLIGEVGGQTLLSAHALAACARIGFFSGGGAYVWGDAMPQAFTGCDLAPWRSPKPAAARGARRAIGTYGAPVPHSAARGASVDLPAGLPLAGFAAQGTTAPPRVRVLGPRGERAVSQAGKALVGSRFVIVPVAAERRTFVFVRRPSAGRWRVQTLDGARLRALRSAQGLPAPRVSGVLERDGAAVALSYEVTPLRGQQVTFIERTHDGIAKVLGRAGGRSGRLRFTPASTGQDARIQASVVQDGFPRATVEIARFRAATGKAPAAPARVLARRTARGLALSWPRANGAARYRVDVLQGARRIARRTTTKTRLRLTRVPATTLRVQLRTIASDGLASTARSTTVRRAR